MQQLQLGSVTDQQARIFNLARENEVVVKIASYKRGLDYPCGCRHCRGPNMSPGPRTKTALAAIDVYDIPAGVDFKPADYFH
jgi:hypothetical protein